MRVDGTGPGGISGLEKRPPPPAAQASIPRLPGGGGLRLSAAPGAGWTAGPMPLPPLFEKNQKRACQTSAREQRYSSFPLMGERKGSGSRPGKMNFFQNSC